jgi:3-oxoacyl-[acyl-carrier protein] reductase
MAVATMKNGGAMQAAKLFDLSGRVAIVTGASSGLGTRFAKVLAANGAKVICIARRKERLEAVVSTIVDGGGSALAVTADVTDRASVVAALESGRDHFGPIDILINNAGIARTGRSIDQPPALWREVMSVNLDAVYFTAQLAAQQMVAHHRRGSIINIASILGFHVSKGTSAYAAAKAAVVQLTRAMALEFAQKNIRVNAIAPGWFVTDLNRDFLESEQGGAIQREIPLGRFGVDGDLDGVVLLLASEAGRFITGATIVVDGGHLVQLRG